MKLEKLCCPSCGAPLTGDFAPNQQVECASCGTPLLLTHLDSENPIFCPHCRTLNANEMHFCVNCGHKLKTDCVLCYTENRVDAIYCARCGAHLERARARRRKLEETRRRLAHERVQALEVKAARQKQENLERLLADLDEPENHDFAIYQINQMGVEAVEALTNTLLHDPDPDARYGSARALGQIYVEKEIKTLVKARTVKALIQSLVDPEPAVRFWAANALGKCKSQTAIKPLAELLRDPHEGVRQQAALSLEQIGGEQAQEILQRSQSRGFLKWLRGN